MTMVLDAPTDRDLLAPLRRLAADAPAMTLTGLMLAALIVPTLAAMALDTRTLDGVSIWAKPLKFELSLAVYTLTLAVFARWLPPGGRLFRAYMLIVTAAITYEMLWIGGAAMWGTRSHFNQNGAMGLLYTLAGIGAVTLTTAALVQGLRFRRAATGLPPALHLSIWLGLILTFVLTIPVAGYMSSATGHYVGAVTGAPGLPLMGWSREAGDLRVPHFLATHAMHALPLLGLAVAGLPRGRTLVLAGAGAWCLLVAATFAQALAGRPFLAFLG
jgi:hypothetical protein